MDAEEVGNYEHPISTLDGFIDRLQSSTSRISKGIIESAKESILDPITQSIQDQRRLIKQIESDLRQTEKEQKGTRGTVATPKEQDEALQGRCEELMDDIEKLAG